MAQAAKKKIPDKFTWEGVDRKGKKMKGELEGASVAFINASLRRQGIKPTKVRKVPKPLFAVKKKITAKDLSIFSNQIGNLCK